MSTKTNEVLASNISAVCAGVIINCSIVPVSFSFTASAEVSRSRILIPLLAGPVATFKEDDDAQAIVFHPFLELAQFSVKPLEFFFVFLPFQLWLETAIVFFPLGHNYPPHNRARYFVAAIDLRKSVTLYAKNASPIPPTIAKLRHTASSPPPR